MRIVLLPNTLAHACDNIDELQDIGVLSAVAGRLLKALYARGWDDGIALFRGDELQRETGMTRTTINLALYELLVEGLARWRSDAQNSVLELPALASVDGERWPNLSWWYYRIVDDREAA